MENIELKPKSSLELRPSEVLTSYRPMYDRFIRRGSGERKDQAISDMESATFGVIDQLRQMKMLPTDWQNKSEEEVITILSNIKEQLERSISNFRK